MGEERADVVKVADPRNGEVWTCSWIVRAGGGVAASDVPARGPDFDYWQCMSDQGQDISIEVLASREFHRMPVVDQMRIIDEALTRDKRSGIEGSSE